MTSSNEAKAATVRVGIPFSLGEINWHDENSVGEFTSSIIKSVGRMVTFAKTMSVELPEGVEHSLELVQMSRGFLPVLPEVTYDITIQQLEGDLGQVVDLMDAPTLPETLTGNI